MPEVNGIELLSQVKADANLRAVPVVSEWRPSTAAHVLRPADASRWEQLHGCLGGLWWGRMQFHALVMFADGSARAACPLQ